MTPKKNRVSIFGKTFHVTPAGKILPLGAKNNKFTKCVHEATKDKMATGEGADVKGNREKFRAAAKSCKGTKTTGKRGKAAKAA